MIVPNSRYTSVAAFTIALVLFLCLSPWTLQRLGYVTVAAPPRDPVAIEESIQEAKVIKELHEQLQQPTPVSSEPPMTQERILVRPSTEADRQNLVEALFYAIREREREERARGYTSDSAMLASWKLMLEQNK